MHIKCYEIVIGSLEKRHIWQVMPIVTISTLLEARNDAKQNNKTYSFIQIRTRIIAQLITIAKPHMDKPKFWIEAVGLAHT
ncbi:hypothetical protein LIER_33796 [Lithospermum erythrorhizon]|uniref:Uncharacterized protein n=1 Tax=Lithospermum erythrorhizon TaxID=34254 RepID=A0AAV3RXP5_LITER